MKSYNVNERTSSSSKNETDIVNKHKREHEKTISNKSNNIETESPYVFDNGLEPLDEPPDKLEPLDDEEPKIEQPMWQSNEKRQKMIDKKIKAGKIIDTTPTWQKPPSRMSTGAWLTTLVIILIPVLNIILTLIWSFFSDSVPEEKKNFSRAFIILAAIMTTVVISLSFIGIKALNIKPSFNGPKSSVSSYASDISNAAKESIENELVESSNEYSGLKGK